MNKEWINEDGCVFPKDEFNKGVDKAQERLIHEEYGMMPKNIDKLMKVAMEEAFEDIVLFGECITSLDANGLPECIRVGTDKYNELYKKANDE